MKKEYNYTKLFMPTEIKKSFTQPNVFFLKNIDTILIFTAG